MLRTLPLGSSMEVFMGFSFVTLVNISSILSYSNPKLVMNNNISDYSKKSGILSLAIESGFTLIVVILKDTFLKLQL